MCSSDLPQHLFSKKEAVPWITPPHAKEYPRVALWETSLSTDVIDPPDILPQQKLSCHDGIVPYNHCTLIIFVEDPCLHKRLWQKILTQEGPRQYICVHCAMICHTKTMHMGTTFHLSSKKKFPWGHQQSLSTNTNITTTVVAHTAYVSVKFCLTSHSITSMGHACLVENLYICCTFCFLVGAP